MFQGIGFALALLVAVSSVYMVYRLTLQSPTVLKWHPYAYSDLLINYGQGFVRRGLFGSCVLAYAKGSSALPATNFVLFWNFVVLMVCMVVLSLRRSPLRFWNVVFVLAIPGGLLNTAVTSVFLPKREMFFYSQLALAGLAVSAVQAMRPGAVKRYAAYCATGGIFLATVVLSFVHEAFLFIAAPANFFLMLALARSIQTDRTERGRRPAGMWFAYMGLAVLLFLVLGHFNGDAGTSQRMWDGLSKADRDIMSPDGTIYGGMVVFGGAFGSYLKLSVSKMVDGRAWYWLVPLFGLGFYCLTLAALNEERGPEAESRFYRWVVCYLTLALCAGPLFILGWDWGRWINSINWSFLILWLSIQPRNLTAVGYDRGLRLLSTSEEQPFLRGWLKPRSSGYLEFARRHSFVLMGVMFFFAMTFRLEDVFVSEVQGYILGPGSHLLHHDLMRVFHP